MDVATLTGGNFTLWMDLSLDMSENSFLTGSLVNIESASSSSDCDRTNETIQRDTVQKNGIIGTAPRTDFSLRFFLYTFSQAAKPFFLNITSHTKREEGVIKKER